MTQLNLGLAAFGIALAVHRLADNTAFSWLLVAFSLGVTAIIFLKMEVKGDAISKQIDIMLCFTLSIFGGVLSWL